MYVDILNRVGVALLLTIVTNRQTNGWTDRSPLKKFMVRSNLARCSLKTTFAVTAQNGCRRTVADDRCGMSI